MWGWPKQSDSTDILLRKQNLQLQKLLADALKDSQALNQKLTDALDRVLISKFDPPLQPRPTEQPQNVAFPDLSDVLSIEDDKEFLERTNA